MKLIDADKLLEWLEDNQDKYADVGTADKMYCEGREDAYRYTKHAIHAGTFDIKPKENEYKCPNCRSVRTRDDWNKETEIKYGEVIVKLGDKDEAEANYICPTCEQRAEFNELEVGTND